MPRYENGGTFSVLVLFGELFMHVFITYKATLLSITRTLTWVLNFIF